MEEGICPAVAAMPLPSPPPSTSSALQEASAKRPPPPAPPRPPRSSSTQSSSPLSSDNHGNYPFRRSNSNSSCSFPSAAAAAAALRTGASSSSSSSPSSYSASSSSRLSRSYQGFPTSASSSYREAKRDSGGNHSFGGGAAAGGLVRTGYTPAFKPNSSSPSPSPPSSFSPSLFSSASARASSSTPPPRPPRNAGRPFHASTVSVPYAPSSSPPPSFSSSEVVSRSRSLGDENEIYQREEQNEQLACNNNNSIAIEDKKKALQAAGFLPAGGLPAAFAPVPPSSPSSPLSSSSGGKEKEKEKGKEKKKLWQTLRPRLGSSSEETNVDDEQQQAEEKDKKKKKQKSRREKKSKDKEDLEISMPSGGAFSLPFTPTPELAKHNNIKNNKRPSTSPPRTQQHGTLRGLRQEKEGTGAQLSPNVVATLRRPRGKGPNHQRPKSMGSFIRANASSGVAVVVGSPPSSASTRTRPTSPLASVSATASTPSPLSLSSSSVPTSADINNSSSPASSPSTPSFSPSSFTPSLSSPSPKPQQMHRASLPAPVASFFSVQQQQQQQPSEGEEPSVYSRSLSSSYGNNLHLEDSHNNNNLTARRTQQRSNCQELLQQEEARRKNSLEKKTPPTPPPRFPSVSSSYSSTPSYSENGEENEETITTMTANEAVQKNLATAPVTPFYYYSSPQDANAEEEEEEEEEICSIWEEDLTDTTTILFSLVSEQGSAVEADPLYTEPVPATASVALADGRREVKAATFNRLIAVLTSDKGVDPAFVKTFLLTYQSFCTPEKLLMKLQERYNVPADFHREEQKPKRVLEASSNNHSNGAESAAEAATETSKDGEEAEIESKLQAQVRKSIQLRVCNVVKKWIEGYYEYDFSPIMRTNLMKWIEREIRPNSDIHATTLLSSLKKVISGETKRKTVPLSEPPEPILPKKDINFSTASLYRAIIRTSPLELARQQCLIEMSIFEKIRPPELLNQAWNKKKSQAPNVLSSIQYFNYFSRGVAATIVHTEVLRKRIKLYTHFVQMAYHLRKLNNFNSLMAVLAGLNSSPVHRLKHTRQGIPQRWKETYEELEQLMASKHAFKWYRETLRFAELPALPYLGVHLSDLTFIDENPNFIVGENGTKLINMKKRKLVYTVISKLQTFQDVPYHLVPVEFIQDLLRALPNSEDKELYELSLVREPRDAERADLL
ncbi:RasGEF domain containing protein [Balamuthia mandrillaris]